ncbi:MAG: hypothetical protein V4478_03780 [Patescibacteria group bacterium]
MNFNEKTKNNSMRAALLALGILVLSSTVAIAQRPTVSNSERRELRQSSRSGVYKTISDLIEQDKKKADSAKPVIPATVTPSKNIPPIDEPKKPIVEPVAPKPAVKSAVVAAPKKNLMYKTMQRFVPIDPYIENGFGPITSSILYGVSGIIALAGILLIIGRPAPVARRLASLFTFA